MAKSKYVYAVMVRIKNNTYRYVTGLEPKHIAFWKEGEKAMLLGKYEAENLVLGLRCNLHVALLLKVEEYMIDCLVNDFDSEDKVEE